MRTFEVFRVFGEHTSVVASIQREQLLNDRGRRYSTTYCIVSPENPNDTLIAELSAFPVAKLAIDDGVFFEVARVPGEVKLEALTPERLRAYEEAKRTGTTVVLLEGDKTYVFLVVNERDLKASFPQNSADLCTSQRA